MSAVLVLPTWSAEMKDSDDPLVKFIYRNEPAGREVCAEFREELATLVTHLTGMPCSPGE